MYTDMNVCSALVSLYIYIYIYSGIRLTNEYTHTAYVSIHIVIWVLKFMIVFVSNNASLLWYVYKSFIIYN